ncbi:hypothetical protein GCM10027047_34300 [Rhodococcus aerolatus]
MTRAVRVFVSARAQQDNLGDVVLRRTLLEWLELPGPQLHVLLGSCQDYNDALSLPPTARVYPSNRRWMSTLVRSLVRSRVVLVYAPGPQDLDLRGGGWRHAGVNLVVSAAVRASGGTVAKVGRGYTGESRLGTAVERAVLRSCSLATVRDRKSLEQVGPAHVVLAPDLALSAVNLRAPKSGRRPDRAALSFRADAGLSMADIRRCIGAVRSSGYTPVLVTQVKRDDALHAQLAGELECERVAWKDGVGHAEQLTRVLDAYAGAAVVVTNRLHSAIFAMNVGAVPVIYAAEAYPKAARTLEAVGVGGVVVDVARRGLDPDDVARWAAEVEARRRDAARSLECVQTQLCGLVAAGPTDAPGARSVVDEGARR